MIENDFVFPTLNEWPGIEILNATDAERIQVTYDRWPEILTG